MIRMLNGNPSTLITSAYLFAKHAHGSIGHKRKYTGDPYIVHPVAVAHIVDTIPHNEVMLAAALLHDTVEDTQATIGEIERLFGTEVAELVGWLTDVSKREDGNRATRKAIDREHTAQSPAAAQTLKLADLIDNSKSIIAHDLDFARVYLREKAALLEVLKQGDPALWLQAKLIVLDGIKTIELAA